MARRRLHTLADLHRARLLLRAECVCGRVVALDPLSLLERCRRERQSRDLWAIVQRLRCKRCGGRVRDWGTFQA